MFILKVSMTAVSLCNTVKTAMTNVGSKKNEINHRIRNLIIK